MDLTRYRKLAGLMERPSLTEGVSDLSGVTFKIRRVGNGRTAFELMAPTKVDLTPYEKDWSIAPGSFKPNQFARVEVEKKLLETTRLGMGAEPPDFDSPPPKELMSPKTKSTPTKRDPEFSTVYSLVGAVVGSGFQGKGYGVALFLKALEWVSAKGYWLASDFKGSDTEQAQATWRALFKYSQHTMTSQYWTTVLPPRSAHPFFAAHGVNAAGLKALAAMGKES